MPEKLIKIAVCIVLFINLFACSALSSPSAPTASAAELKKRSRLCIPSLFPIREVWS